MRTHRSVIAFRLLGSFAVLTAVLALPPLAPSAHADDAQRAKDLFQEGTRYFDLGQFDKAIDAWQSGYREKADAVFLYNIAQAYRLAGDLGKAIFFYKGFLRNSPKAHNRPEVEQRIAALQKQLAEQQEAAKSSPSAAPPAAGREPIVAPAPAAAPPAAAPPSTPASPSAPAPAAPAPSAFGTTTTVDVPPAPAAAATVDTATGAPVIGTAAEAAEVARPLDLGVGIGVDGWSSGVQGKANASFALMLAAGYTLGRNPGAPVRFRLGAHFGYTFLKEASSRETFLSLLAVPTLLIRASPRVGFFAELGVGVLGISGLKPSSALLDHSVMLRIDGTQGLLELRPALGAQFQLTPGLGLFVSAAVDYSPKRAHFYQPISRTELLIGLSFRR